VNLRVGGGIGYVADAEDRYGRSGLGGPR
jgi:hypothetical protein